MTRGDGHRRRVEGADRSVDGGPRETGRVKGRRGGKPENTPAVWGVFADKLLTAKKLTEALVPLAK